MRQNTPRTTHTYTREKPSGLKACTNSHGRVWAGRTVGDKNGEGWAYLWAATSNATSLTTDDLDGAKELEEEDEDEEDEVLTDQLLDELDAVIVSGGKTVNETRHCTKRI
jgi:hypothetical protein